jgi:hypothetical protein
VDALDQAVIGGEMQFTRPENSFGPELVAALIAVYDRAVASLHDNGQPEIVREAVAGHTLIACAKPP